MNKTNKMITSKELSDLLRCSLRTVYRMRKRGDITAYKMGGKIVFKKEEIEEYLENLQQAA